MEGLPVFRYGSYEKGGITFSFRSNNEHNTSGIGWRVFAVSELPGEVFDTNNYSPLQPHLVRLHKWLSKSITYIGGRTIFLQVFGEAFTRFFPIGNPGVGLTCELTCTTRGYLLNGT